MIEVAKALNSFAQSPAEQTVPTEEPIFVLTGSQLQAIIHQAIQPLQDEICQLKALVVSHEDELAALKATVNQYNEARCSEIAFDRRRIAKLENPVKEPGKTELSRAEKIAKYLAARPDHRATFETLKGHLGVNKVLLNQAIKALMGSEPGRYGITRTQGDKRKRTLTLLQR
jgi:hypothetical protein